MHRFLIGLFLLAGFIQPLAAFADNSADAVVPDDLNIDVTIEPRTGASNMDGELYTLSQAASEGASLQDLQGTNLRLVFDDQGRVQVQLYIAQDTERSARKTVIGLGGLLEQAAVSDGEGGLILQCWLPPSALQTAADSVFVNYVRAPAYVQMYETLQLGTETTQGVEAANADTWHTAGITGSGVKVMIIDGGFYNWVSLVSSGELPSTTEFSDFSGVSYEYMTDSGKVHGNACAEIVADMAPDAQLYLARIATNADLPEAVTWAISLGVDVISTSIGWDYVAAGDGTGALANQVQRARDAGIFWATAAGNEAEQHISGDYTDNDGDGFHEFSGGSEVAILNNASPGDKGYFAIRWSDWTDCDQNLRVELWGDDGSWTRINYSDDVQNGGLGQRPLEFLDFRSPDSSPDGLTDGLAEGYSRYGVVVYGDASVTDSVHFDVVISGYPAFISPNPNYALCDLADSPAAITVGALDTYFDPYALEDYSSGGPTNGAGGIGTDGADKPEIAAYANVLTASYAGYLFNGTSSATPHVAGLAALVAQACPSWGPDEIEAYLTGNAEDVEASGYDWFTGYGRLVVPDSTPTAATPTPVPTLDPSMTHVMLPLVLK